MVTVYEDTELAAEVDCTRSCIHAASCSSICEVCCAASCAAVPVRTLQPESQPQSQRPEHANFVCPLHISLRCRLRGGTTAELAGISLHWCRRTSEFRSSFGLAFQMKPVNNLATKPSAWHTPGQKFEMRHVISFMNP